MKKETKEWLNIAEEDKEVAEMTWKTKRYVYAIMFWQQAVEKIIKAYTTEVVNILPKKTHDIDQLLQQAKLNINELDIKDTKELTRAFMRTRYEDLSRKYYSDKKKVEPLVKQAQEIYLWIEKLLNNL
ncbi:MAG: hypothetical protein UR56_C0029G0011 [Candidatus Roizmanbacteria bacterium GW2011_GWC2_34_23]|uniref:HEPN domain-containing protein n=1 Tax=Candidatus Roizmanbacteria bacterium GW2011_GWC2_34_23 TaxID=1618484 RepID=A0A0G0DYE5_9BACT|nr:MAG: hypothetical protein UR56_C0029G0011 [Candidatus Roizmanbacteria bacterium GW2011_GWC2_34_23]